MQLWQEPTKNRGRCSHIKVTVVDTVSSLHEAHVAWRLQVTKRNRPQCLVLVQGGPLSSQVVDSRSAPFPSTTYSWGTWPYDHCLRYDAGKTFMPRQLCSGDLRSKKSVTIFKMRSFTILQGNSLSLRWFQDTPMGPGLLGGAWTLILEEVTHWDRAVGGEEHRENGWRLVFPPPP